MAFLVPALDMGGGARTALYIASGLAELGYQVDLIVLEPGGPLEAECPDNVRIVRPAPSQAIITVGSRLMSWISGTHYAGNLLEKIPFLVRYLNRHQPTVLAAFAGSTAAILATALSRTRCRTAISAQVVLSPIIKGKDRFRAAIQRQVTLRCFANADIIIAVSQGVANDITKLTGISAERVRVIFNPVVTPGFYDRANERVDHPWFARDNEPVVLAVGQFKPQKDFATLIRAFARVRIARRAKLVILGEGYERAMLETLVNRLGLHDCVAMPGYKRHPYNFMRLADVFVLTSKYEGFGLVLAEALAVGVPIVATDCAAGPAEILDNGRFGKLVPVGDVEALATAILDTLEAPPDRRLLRARGCDFSIDAILPQYVEALGLLPVAMTQ